MKRYSRKKEVLNRFLSFIAFVCCTLSLVVSGYFFLFHEDSKAQQWISSIESYFGIEEEPGTEAK